MGRRVNSLWWTAINIALVAEEDEERNKSWRINFRFILRCKTRTQSSYIYSIHTSLMTKVCSSRVISVENCIFKGNFVDESKLYNAQQKVRSALALSAILVCKYDWRSEL